MTAANESKNRILSAIDARPWAWLLLGGALVVASQARFGIGLLAWIAPIPWLRYLRLRSGWRARLAVLGAATVAFSLTFLKIITAPLPPVFGLAFGVPVGLVLVAPYLLTPTLRRLGEPHAVIGFGALSVCAEWVLHGALELGTWGAAANTQLEQLALLQLASVTGLHGISFLVLLVAATLESTLASPSVRRRRALLGVLALVGVTVVAGEARLAASVGEGGERTRVAAIGTDSTVGQGPLPSAEEVEAVHQGLYARTRAAAASGAQLVVWTEAATMTEPANEQSFLAEVSALARETQVTIVAGYVVPVSTEPLRYRNRYAYVTPEGIDHVYDKHHPVPGEPAVRGTEPMPLVETEALGRVSGAICYDYDFPRLGLEHAELDVDLVALPASDWRGIDPIHTQMASLRAIEGGHSLVRSTRFGLSAGYDPQGRARGWLSHFDEGDRVLVMSLPRHGVSTVYGALGDWFPGLCALASLLLLGLAARRLRYARAPWRTPFSASRAERSSRPANGSASTATRSSPQPS